MGRSRRSRERGDKMGVRYSAIWKSMKEVDYKIDILDTDYSSTASDFDIDFDGFTLNYEGDPANRTNPILASKCTVTLGCNNTAAETLISDIANADEQQFVLKIYKKVSGNWKLDWLGYILTDLISYPDAAFPYKVILTATDSLGRLANIDYKNGASWYTGQETFLEHLFNLLNKTGLQTYFEIDNELVTNGTLTTDTDWIKGPGWTIASGVGAVSVAGYLGILYQVIAIEKGKKYEVTYTITSISSGSIQVLCGYGGFGTDRSTSGTFTEEIICDGDDRLYFISDENTAATIDNISVKPIADEYLISCVQWFEDYMGVSSPFTSNPLTLAAVNHEAYIKIKSDDSLEAMNCLEVLKSICTQWDAQLMQSEGSWRFIQSNQKRNTTLITNSYKTDAVAHTTDSAADIKVSSFNRTDGIINFLPILANISSLYKYRIGSNPYPDAYEDGDTIPGGSGLDLEITLDIDEATPHYYDDSYVSAYDLTIKIGSYYYGDSQTWSTTAQTYTLTGGPCANFRENKELTMIAYNIPITGVMDFSIALSSTAYVPAAFSFTLNSEVFQMVYPDNPDTAIMEQTTELDNDTNTNAGTHKSLSEVFQGDGPELFSVGAIKVSNGTYWTNSYLWKIQATGTAQQIDDLLLEEVMAGQKSAVKCWSGIINGVGIYAHNALVMDSDKYIFSTGSFNANRNQWTATWIKAQYE